MANMDTGKLKKQAHRKSVSLIWIFLLFQMIMVSCLASGYSINSGKYATLNQSMQCRSGPGFQYASLGSFLSSGTEVSTLTAVRDSQDGNWWIQVEFSYQGKLRRAYVSASCLTIDASSLPSENSISKGTVQSNCTSYWGPGNQYANRDYAIYAGTDVTIYSYENGFVQIDYITSSGTRDRAWIDRGSL